MNLPKLAFLVGAACLNIANAQVTSDTLWFLPGVPITRYAATVVVPAVSPGPGYHAVWPGLENNNAGFVYQSVISDSKGVGSWQFWVEYCCNPDYKANSIKVYPGDTITSVFTVDGGGIWTDAWSLVPGATGLAAGQKAQSGSTSNNFDSQGALTQAVLAIELQKGGKWDFGPIQWSNIAITASTTTSWCADSYAVMPEFQYSISGGTSSTSGGSTTCSYPSVLFKSP
ncbi:Uncharacterized protein BP5553_04068 [Venustampulla echinocandica]|uniref:Uncharacterized protein n=1 Tax=Venustampulla echinocandica TaxID=2656787 RepID=A0A370TW71_9HELO|nr:Uncharacterized protein BP5553_04068 [Venustampulla echinocandica]RDL39728.1 Uncharacterized protein BP5553_04068 [Venustampulla echinocandica]